MSEINAKNSTTDVLPRTYSAPVGAPATPAQVKPATAVQTDSVTTKAAAGTSSGAVLGLPPLPDVKGPRGDIHLEGAGMKTWGDSPPMSMAAALGMLASMALNKQTIDGSVRNTAHKQAADLTQADAEELKAQVKGERVSAGIQLGVAVVGAVASAGVGYQGGKLNAKGQQVAKGAALQAAGQAVGGLVNAIGTMFDKNMGAGQYAADQAKIQQKIIQYFLQSAKAIEDNFDKQYDSSGRNFDKALEDARSIQDARNSTSMTIAQNTAV